jgi:hypothetical protein
MTRGTCRPYFVTFPLGIMPLTNPKEQSHNPLSEEFMRNVALCTLFIAAVSFGQQPSKSISAAPSVDHSCARYQIFFGPHARADQYLVDTTTGRIWQKTSYTDLVGEPEVWLPLTRVDNDADFNAWVKKQTVKPKAE